MWQNKSFKEILEKLIEVGFFCHLLTFFKSNLKKSFRNTIRMSNGLHLDQDQSPVGPDLSSNCLQRLSADDKVTANTETVNQTAISEIYGTI